MLFVAGTGGYVSKRKQFPNRSAAVGATNVLTLSYTSAHRAGQLCGELHARKHGHLQRDFGGVLDWNQFYCVALWASACMFCGCYFAVAIDVAKVAACFVSPFRESDCGVLWRGLRRIASGLILPNSIL